MDTELPDIPRKGRGAVSNQTGRFEGYNAVALDDGWGLPPDEDLPPLRTTVTADATRTIIARNTSPDVPFDRSTDRSIPIAGASMAASIASRARPTRFSAYRRGSTSKVSFFTSRMPPPYWRQNSARNLTVATSWR